MKFPQVKLLIGFSQHHPWGIVYPFSYMPVSWCIWGFPHFFLGHGEKNQNVVQPESHIWQTFGVPNPPIWIAAGSPPRCPRLFFIARNKKSVKWYLYGFPLRGIHPATRIGPNSVESDGLEKLAHRTTSPQHVFLTRVMDSGARPINLWTRNAVKVIRVRPWLLFGSGHIALPHREVATSWQLHLELSRLTGGRWRVCSTSFIARILISQLPTKLLEPLDDGCRPSEFSN